MAKEKMMTTISANVKEGEEIIGQLVKEVADHSLEQEWLALQLKALGLSTEVVTLDVEPLVID